MTGTSFAEQYLATWTEPDAHRRRRNIEALWAPDGRMVVSSVGADLHGVDAIAAHVGNVHDQRIAGDGLTFVYDQELPAADATLLRWSMLAPDGSVVGRGADTVLKDDDGRVRTVYMFMGVD